MRNIDQMLTGNCPTCGKHGYAQPKTRWLATEIDSGLQSRTARQDPSWHPLNRRELLDCFAKTERAAIPKDAILAITRGSADIFEATREGVEVASSEGRPVVFPFNGQVVLCSPGADAEAIARAWWQAVYHETPEESYARR